MSAWIESEDGIWEHHKTVKLCGLLGIKLVAAVGHLTSLWHFVLRNAWRDADLSPWGDAGIEMACRWEGEAGKMVKALRECGRDGGPGFLEGSTVHGWLERAGKLVQDRFYNEKRRQDVAQKNTDAVKRRKSDATNPTQPNPTIPNQRHHRQLPLAGIMMALSNGGKPTPRRSPRKRRERRGRNSARAHRCSRCCLMRSRRNAPATSGRRTMGASSRTPRRGSIKAAGRMRSKSKPPRPRRLPRPASPRSARYSMADSVPKA